MSEGPKYNIMPLAKVWSPTNSIAWVRAHEEGAVPVLCRAWQCMKTGEIEWKALETVVLGPSDPPVFGESE